MLPLNITSGKSGQEVLKDILWQSHLARELVLVPVAGDA